MRTGPTSCLLGPGDHAARGLTSETDPEYVITAYFDRKRPCG